jgi:prenyltransferase beta subunit
MITGEFHKHAGFKFPAPVASTVSTFGGNRNYFLRRMSITSHLRVTHQLMNPDTESTHFPIAAANPRQNFWQRMGGGSLMVAASFHALLLLIGAAWVYNIITPTEKNDAEFIPTGGGDVGERGAEHKVQDKKRQQMSPTTTNAMRTFAKDAISTYLIPEQGDKCVEMASLDSMSGGGMPSGLMGSALNGSPGNGPAGPGIGMNDGGTGKLFIMIPETMRKRCSKQDRLARLKENGGTPECEEAVMKSLRWLKSIQNPDGSWGEDKPAEYSGKSAMTGFVLLAYLGHCETPMSEEFGDSCLRGITYLVNLGMKNDGKMGTHFHDHWCYEHAVATYALGEAATFCTQLKIAVPNLMEVTEKAGQFIIDNQHENGGWAYSYATKGGHPDVSIAGWHLQALKACSHTNIRYRGMVACVGKGLNYLESCQAPNGGFGYAGMTPAHGDYFTMTGVGVLCNQMWGKGSAKDAKKGIEYISLNTKLDYATAHSDLYQHYYEAQVMMQAGGSEWKKYNDLFRDQILLNQNADGIWKQPGSGNNAYLYGKNTINGKLYRNVACTLMLEVYYRFLATGGGGSRGHGI